MEILSRRFARSIGAIVLSAAFVVVAFSQAADEYEVKAAFIYNFTKFVEWPSLSADIFSICIVGDDPFGGTLDQLVKGKTAYNRPIQVRRLKEVGESRQCQIVFVRQEEEVKGAKLVEVLRGMPVLTVSEGHKFGKIGGMIFLSMKEGHMNVGINSDAATSVGLKISAKLLTLAKSGSEGR